MSDLLIKGMKMPERCVECPMLEYRSEFVKCPMLEYRSEFVKCKASGQHFLIREEWGNRRHPDCPLVEISTPHGRLIDADELGVDMIMAGQENRRGKYKIGDPWELNGAEIRGVIRNAPTIIEAEESDE